MGKLAKQQPADDNRQNAEEEASTASPGSTMPVPSDAPTEPVDTETTASTSAADKPADKPDAGAAPVPYVPLPSKPHTPIQWLTHWMGNKKVRIGASFVFVVLLAVCIFVPPVAYTLLNMVSSSKAQFVVVDDETLAPVEGASVAVAGHSGKTDKKGKVTVSDIPYGTNNYTITKTSYRTYKGTTTVKPGTNTVGPLKIHSDGTPVAIKVTNSLSKEAIKSFSVTIDDTNLSAQADKNGQAILKVPSSKVGKLSIAVSATGYNTTKQDITVTASQPISLTAALTPSGKHYFLSNRSGKVDVYMANLDGSDGSVVIAGTGAEDRNTVLSTSPDGMYGALISKRENLKGADGNVTAALYIIDFDKKTVKRVDEGAPGFSVIGWASNTQLTYRVDYYDYTATQADNYKIKSVDATKGQLATHYTSRNYINTYFYREDPTHVYVVQSDQSVENYGIISVDIAAKKTQRLHKEPSYDFYHVRPYFADFSINKSWYALNMKTQQIQSGASVNSDKQTAYTPSPDSQRLAWIEDRDGKGAVIVGNVAGVESSAALHTDAVHDILSWHDDNYLIFAGRTSSTTNAHYILHIPTGTVSKISDTYGGNSSQH